ncbi:MAG: hydantoinase B/oxoprolinase family protein [Burkholderiales bacterium]|nr:hydantoinase B/oxoprolinase family protein [Burkholderiales bacterium]
MNRPASSAPSPAPRRWRIGFDIGGTFTDFVLFDRAEGRVHLHKRLTSADDPARSALIGLEELIAKAGVTLAQVDDIVHGTTLVTNAIIERKGGARLGLLVTEGFRDLLELGTEQRYDIYDLFLKYPEPLVPRSRCLEVRERVDAEGGVVTELDERQLRRVLGALVEDGVNAVAVCFLHAYRFPQHEQRVAALAAREFPQLAVSLSSAVVPELSEYPRCVTTAANAFVQPLMGAYLEKLESELAARGFAGALRLMHSAGGLMSPQTAREFPIRLLESGPAGGGLATAWFGQLAGHPDVISFDMGGTTAKAALIEGGRFEIMPVLEAARVQRFTKGSGLPIKTPVIDMIEIGAGGGSIASIDTLGLLKVGPQSASSAPGPACYGLGGIEPTVTDACLLLGYYDPGFFLGGTMKLDVAAAERAMARVAQPLGLSIAEAAWGIHALVVDSMAAAARVHLVEHGKDPRSFSMVGFGGAGPAHAVDVARVLGVAEVIVPPASGAASAFGFLAAPLSFEQVQSMPLRLSELADGAPLNRVLGELERQGRAQLRAAGVADADVSVSRFADMRLVGQMHDIRVALPEGEIGPQQVPALREAFVAAYRKRYTAVPPSAAFEAINFRVNCAGPSPELTVAGALGSESGREARKGVRRAWFGDGFVDVAVYDRDALRPGDDLPGPCIVEEREATTVLGPLDRLRVDRHLNLCVAVGSAVAREVTVTRDMPLAQAIDRIEADPISLEIMWSRLVNVVDEMWLTVCRTAFSLVISEAQDFACEILSPEGETLAHSPRAMPVFNLTLPRAVKALLERYPAETLQPGDVLITNDPWLCAGHLFDIAIVSPVFVEGRVVGLLGTVGHVADIGGTKDSLQAREIYEEGLQIPPMKLALGGELNETLVALIEKNVRNGEQVLGDLHSFMAANALGGERLAAFMHEYGMQDLRALAAVVQSRSEKAMREAISRLPDGVYRSEMWNNPLGTPLRFPLALTVAGDTIEIDFEGAPPQLARGGLNSTLNYTAAHATYPLKCILTPQVRGNAGCYKPFTVKAPAGSILNCNYPASVSVRTRTGWYIAPNIFRAVAEAAPRAVQSFTGLPVAMVIYGQQADGRIYSDLLFSGGGQGASDGGDGKSGLMYPTSAANTSIELIETRVPVVVTEKALLPDSGGPGRQRGGLAQRVRVRKRIDDGLPMQISVYPEGVGLALDGLFGGAPGGGASAAVLGPDGQARHDCGTGELVTVNRIDEQVELVLAGGSGFGSPAEREPAALARDLEMGWVTREGAARDYGAKAESR